MPALRWHLEERHQVEGFLGESDKAHPARASTINALLTAVSSHSHFDRLLMGSPLRRETVSRRIAIALMCVLAFAVFVQLGLFAGMARERLIVFIEALVSSTALSIVPIAVLRSLDRRERESA